jgi:hypothetical protein
MEPVTMSFMRRQMGKWKSGRSGKVEKYNQLIPGTSCG